MAVGMGALRAPESFLKSNIEDTEDAEEFLGFEFASATTASLVFREFFEAVVALFLLLLRSSVPSVSSVLGVCLASCFATASSSQSFLLACAAGRLLSHSAEPSSAAIWSRVRWVKTE